MCKQMIVLMLKWIVWNYVKPFNCMQEKRAQAYFLKIIFKMCL